MKYAIVILGGAGDEPCEALGGRTALEAANAPACARVAKLGRVGRVATSPGGAAAGSDVCLMALLGVDPRAAYTGRAPLEAAGRGVELADSDWAFRVNFCTAGPGADSHDALAPGARMLDYSAGHLASEETAALLPGLLEAWKREAPELAAGLELVPGVEYRALLVDRSGRSYDDLETIAAHEIGGEVWREHAPSGGDAPAVNRLMEIAARELPRLEANRARVAAGKPPANLAWIWGQGQRPELPDFGERYAVRAAAIAGVDVMLGLARLMNIPLVRTKGSCSYDDPAELRAWGKAAVRALDEHDLVIVYITAADECSHSGDAPGKVRAIERIDEHVVAPVLARLESMGDPDAPTAMTPGEAGGWRILVACDHATATERRANTAAPAPFALAGSWVRKVVDLPFNEAGAAESDLLVDPGHDLMEYFLFSGLKAPRKAAPIRPAVRPRSSQR